MTSPYGDRVAASMPDKSVGAALVLTFLFGPLGLFYVSIVGAIVMCVGTIVVALLTAGIGLAIVWPICMVWSAVAASRMHSEFEMWRMSR